MNIWSHLLGGIFFVFVLFYVIIWLPPASFSFDQTPLACPSSDNFLSDLLQTDKLHQYKHNNWNNILLYRDAKLFETLEDYI